MIAVSLLEEYGTSSIAVQSWDQQHSCEASRMSLGQAG